MLTWIIDNEKSPSGRISSAWGFFLVASLTAFLTLFSPAQARADTPPSSFDIRPLIEKARSSRIAFSAKWLALGHYEKNLFSISYESSAIDGRGFFLSGTGRSNPESELIATLEGFYGPVTKTVDLHPVCVFPARLRYLSDALKLDLLKMPVQISQCSEFLKFYRSLAPTGLDVVFSSYYLNNPSSAFGHTFIRVTTQHPAGANTEMLDYGINYAANADNQNAVLYALSGLLGWYQGEFTKMPFYYKVAEYGFFESRDLWVYSLNVTPAQIDDFVSHVWELGRTTFKYFFSSRNCSYQILAALDAVNPDWRLVDRLSNTVIPSDTLKVLAATPGLVKKVSYRPSNRTILETRYKTLSPQEKDSFWQMTESNTPVVPPAGQDATKIYDAILDYYDYHYAKKVVHQDPEVMDLKQRFLIARSRLESQSEPLQVDPPVLKEPHLGHGSSRVNFGFGTADTPGTKGGAFNDLDYRLNFHDLLDFADGYPDYGNMEVFQAALRFYYGSSTLQLRRLRLVDVASYSPLTAINHSFSWHFNFEGRRVLESSCPECFGVVTEAGIGETPFTFHESYFYGLVNAKVAYVSSLPTLKLQLGTGPELGAKISLLHNLGVLWRSDLYFYPDQVTQTTFEHHLDLRWSLATNWAVGSSGLLSPAEKQGQLYANFYY